MCPSYPLFVSQVKSWSTKGLIKQVSDEAFAQIQDMNSHDTMKLLGVSYFKLPFFIASARKNIRKKILEIEPNQEIVQVLAMLKKQGFTLGILTSNSEQTVEAYLKKYEMDFFDFIYAANNIFGKDKSLRAILKKANLNPEKKIVVYIGDEVRDIQAAKKINLAHIGVSWGQYDSRSLLESYYPNYVCDDPESLTFLIQQVKENYFIE